MRTRTRKPMTPTVMPIIAARERTDLSFWGGIMGLSPGNVVVICELVKTLLEKPMMVPTGGC